MMTKIAGIIAEYNPFHNGHAYHMQRTRELTGCDYIVVVMSGDFVQRGAPAAFDKYLRAEAALCCGADLVLELPVSCACQSAEFFASGSVSLLDRLGCVDALCFGSEEGDISDLLSLARTLNAESEAYQSALKSHLRLGFSYPAARKKALETTVPDKLTGHLMDSPNNILGIEYLKALDKSGSSIRPYTIRREGNGFHDTDVHGPLASATSIRRYIRETSMPPDHAVPSCVEALLRARLKTEAPVWEDDLSLLLKYALMRNTWESLTDYGDMTEDLSRRIYNKLNDFSSFSQFTSLLKTKEITYTRIARALLNVILNIRYTDIQHTGGIPYARVLGFQKSSAPLLKAMKNHASIPVITKAADYRKILDKNASAGFRQDIFAANLYESVRCDKNKTVFVNDLQKPPVIL